METVASRTPAKASAETAPLLTRPTTSISAGRAMLRLRDQGVLVLGESARHAESIPREPRPTASLSHLMIAALICGAFGSGLDQLPERCQDATLIAM